MTADDIQKLLAAKHAKDLFVAECNLGSAMRGCRRLDAWAMPRSWSPWRTIGYEIKVARGDFLRDNKWREYLPFCHELSFVTPRGLVAPEELPKDVGLLWVSSTGARLYTKRKAVPRTPDPAKVASVMAYCLMSRAHIVASTYGGGVESNPDYWRRWLATKRENRALGYRVSRALAEQCSNALHAQRKAEELAQSYDAAIARLRELGLDPERPVYQWTIDQAIRERLPSNKRSELHYARQTAQRLVEQLAQMED